MLKIDEYAFHGAALALSKVNPCACPDEIYNSMVSAAYRTMDRAIKDGRTGGYEGTGGWYVMVGDYGHGHWSATASVMWSLLPGAVTSWQEMAPHFLSMPSSA